ncbi:MAG TPA: hypothetical protein VMA96_05090 [Solirubrobacteraceae bacterium]|nr:hypothetical protein [Solirubrobacteraceae bacterium]
MSATGAGTGFSPRLRAPDGPATARGPGAGERRLGSLRRWAWWAALPLGVIYLILLAHQLGAAIRATNLDADAASGPVIGELFGAAPAHASVVLGEFGWYATLLFDLATKWLPAHRDIWVAAPYAMALAGAGLTAWSVWQVAGRWAAGLTAVLLVCASPATLRLDLSTTQHAPAWFCLALLGAFAVWLERRADEVRRFVLIGLVLLIGTIVGVNAKSDPLVIIAGLLPFALALIAARGRGRGSTRALTTGAATLAVAVVTWVITRTVMRALAITPEPGLHTTKIVAGAKTVHNARLWVRSVAVLGNGAVSGGSLTPRVALAAACAAVSIAAVVLLPWLGWRALRGPISSRTDRARHAFFAFWCSSAILLSVAFVFSDAPVDIHADRYLVGVLYAAAAVVPAAAALAPAGSARRGRAAAVVLAGTCVFALGAIVSMARGVSSEGTEFHTPVSAAVADQVAQIAKREHLTVGYAGYWDAAPVTWATGFRVHVYPVAVCDQNAHLCRFDLHFISSWYSPRPGTGSFLLTDDRSSQSVTVPTPDLGRPTAVYRIGPIKMYTYPYDLAARIVS